MKILVLGNGFDIDHDLPTSYRDFLNFCNAIVDCSNSKKYDKLTKGQKRYIYVLKNDSKLYGMFKDLLTRNKLLKYFNVQAEKMNWIDFEREIMDIVMEFTNLEKLMTDKGWNTYQIEHNARVHEVIHDLGLSKIESGVVNLSTLSTIHETLCKHFKDFAIALELYIGRFINKTPVDGVAPDIIEYDADQVLTFNYSDTYERIYGGVKWNQCVSYVHGKAQAEDSPKEANIVLGVTSPERVGTSYVEFEKYFQRITKKTGNEYKKWLESAEEITVSFFGHSLDATDSDVIKDFFDYEKAKIKIYYYNDVSYQNIVANLIKIIGKGELIKNVYGNHPKVEFIKQREHQATTTGGVEITRHISALYKLHMYEEDEVNALVKRVRDKVDSGDIGYFHSQRKTISLFDALLFQKIDGFSVKVFGDICNKLDCDARKENMILFSADDWVDYTTFGEEIPCPNEVKQLISVVNETNTQMYIQSRNESPHMHILRMDNEDEIRKGFISMFKECESNEKGWRQLRKLIEAVGENDLWYNVLNEICNDDGIPLFIRVRARHFLKEYDEYCIEESMIWED